MMGPGLYLEPAQQMPPGPREPCATSRNKTRPNWRPGRIRNCVYSSGRPALFARDPSSKYVATSGLTIHALSNEPDVFEWLSPQKVCC